MKHLLVICTLVFGVSIGTFGDDIDLKDEKSKQAYSIGVNIGRNLVDQGIKDANLEALMLGVKDATSGGDTKLTDEEMSKTLQVLTQQIRDYQKEHRAKAAQENASKGAEFLAKNEKRPGVTKTESGLQYEVIKSGTGAKPLAEDEVTVHYRGTLLDGKEFDSSYKRNAPATFQLNRVIRGWTEGLQLMNAGSKYKLYIPSALAYGQSGSRNIPPNSALIFEVELLSFKSKNPPKKPKTQVITSDIIKVPSKAGLEKGEKIEIIKAEDVEKEIKKQKEDPKDK